MATKEKLKTRASRVRAELRAGGQVILRSQLLVHTAECAIRFLLGAVLAGAEVFGGYAPFGLGMVAASGAGLDGFAALLGVCLGYFSFQGFVVGVRYASAAILIFSVSFAFYDVKLCRRSWFMPLVAALMDLVTGGVYLFRQGWLISDVIFFGTELLLCAAGTYFFRIAFSSWQERQDRSELTVRQGVSVLILGGVVLMTLSKLTILGGALSLGRFAAALFVMEAGYSRGIGTGAAVGVSVGLAMDIAAGGAPIYSMAYGFAGLMIGVFRRQSKLFAALSYTLADAVAVLWTWGNGLELAVLYETFAASVFFLLLPRRLFVRLGAVREGAGMETAERAMDYVRARLAAAGEGFRAVGSALRGAARTPGPNDADASSVFDRTAERVCRKCALRERCWQQDYVTTFNALNDALSAMLDKGRGEGEDFPEYFSGRCIHFPDFLASANEELTALLYRRQYSARIRESRGAVGQEFEALSEVLSAAAAELSAPLCPDPIRERRVRSHLTALGLEGEAAVYRDSAGRLHLELEGPRLEGLKSSAERKKLSAILGVPLRQVRWEEGEEGDTLVLCEAEPLSAVAGVAAVQKDGETVSGDTGGWFRLPDGKLCVLLCDGMGSGEAANRDSSTAQRLLEQLLRSGLAPESALQTLDAALALRGEEEGGFTTIDLLEVDLFTGEAAVYKYGAAPTYVNRGGTVSCLTGSALPAGLTGGEGAEPAVSRFRLGAGDLVVLVSDGVATAGEDDWLRARLAAFQGESPRELAAALLECPENPARGGDDRSVMVVRIRERKGSGRAEQLREKIPT